MQTWIIKILIPISNKHFFDKTIPLHKKWNFPFRISSVNVTKSTGNCGYKIHKLSLRFLLKSQKVFRNFSADKGFCFKKKQIGKCKIFWQISLFCFTNNFLAWKKLFLINKHKYREKIALLIFLFYHIRVSAFEICNMAIQDGKISVDHS